jgi:hypothetical protein
MRPPLTLSLSKGHPLTALYPQPYSFPMKLPPFYDLVAALVTCILLIGVICYPLLGHAIPQEILTPFAVAMGWVFRGGVGVANDYYHQKRSAPND